ncbi:hypothetical protein [Bradyrhizobium guangdongense]|uniref:Uncharacterized protein n=1 Tax=Bradyrhizobium guangdongense TaxID=1325090 RepID=A0A410V583_9BRAD|nr:hypothetical protein [Bradyrhizobium guangdongense]QAU38814.1 hypothetical protein X265_14890 [Bradyrhizobium guangdongense]QOZ59872.1 hypothetical protein XH86_14895 [Bradyrhizobium guangdongense]GGI23114.1 hypothetical protein GCM10010987_22760 [Bradyrhizobium guangdongense]
MLPEDREWLRKHLNERVHRHQAKEDMTRELLRRSWDALSRSEELLRLPVPVVWHPEPPKE